MFRRFRILRKTLLPDETMVTDQKPPDNKPPRIIANYAVDANLFRLGSTNPTKNPAPVFFFCFYTGGLLLGGFCPGTFVGGLLT